MNLDVNDSIKTNWDPNLEDIITLEDELLDATENNDIYKVKYLLDYGVNIQAKYGVNIYPKNDLTLQVAITLRNIEIVNLLKDYTSNVTI
jgi:hypothetical protein